jgi:hypothetical protein
LSDRTGHLRSSSQVDESRIRQIPLSKQYWASAVSHTDADDSAGLQPLRAAAAKVGNQLSTSGTAEAVP